MGLCGRAVDCASHSRSALGTCVLTVGGGVQGRCMLVLNADLADTTASANCVGVGCGDNYVPLVSAAATSCCYLHRHWCHVCCRRSWHESAAISRLPRRA
jgi:hypothetical protein